MTVNSQVQPGKLDLRRMEVHVHVVEHPVVELAVVLELERAQGVRDAFQGVGEAVGEVVHRVDAPRVAGAVVRGVPDAVEHRIAHDDVGGGHVDPRPQHVRSVRELPGPHAPEEIQVLGHRAGRGTGSVSPAP